MLFNSSIVLDRLLNFFQIRRKYIVCGYLWSLDPFYWILGNSTLISLPSDVNRRAISTAYVPAEKNSWTGLFCIKICFQLGPHDLSENHSVISDSLLPHGLYSSRNSPGWNSGVYSLSLLQGTFPTQGLNPGLLYHRWIIYKLSHKGSPITSKRPLS